jgi:gliding motility-associated-like protein
MRKLLLLAFLFLSVTQYCFSQRIFWSEELNNRVRVGTLTPSGVAGATNFLSPISSPRTLEVDQINNTLYYLSSYYDLMAVDLTTGAPKATVITTGSMDELMDFSFSDNAGGLFVANSAEVHGVRFVPWNNNDLGTDYELPISGYENEDFSSVAVDDGNEIVYMAHPYDGSIISTGFGGGTPILETTITWPEELAFDKINNDLYILDNGGANYRIFRYDVDNGTTFQLFTLGGIAVSDLQVYPQFGKIYYAVSNVGIYACNMDGSGSPALIYSTGSVGDIHFSIEADNIAPVFTALSPANNTTNLTTRPNLVMTFSENLKIGTTFGSPAQTGISIHRLSDDALFYRVDRSDATVSIVNNVVTISGIPELDINTDYYVLVGPNVFTDLSGNPFIGISTNAGWRFKTNPGITITSSSTAVCEGNFTTIPDIVFTESEESNIEVGSHTLSFEFSGAGYTFAANTGSVSVLASRNLSSTSIAVTSTSVVITYTASAETLIDKITISGLQVSSSNAANGTVNIVRTSGTALIDGLISGTVVSSVSTTARPAAPTVTYTAGSESLCVGESALSSVVNATGSNLKWYSASDLLTEYTSVAGSNAATGADLSVSTGSAAVVNRYVTQTVSGCSSNASTITITVFNVPQNILISTVDQTSCSGPNGEATVTGVDGGGVAGYEFEWYTDASVPLGETSATANGLPAGGYVVYVKNSTTGCVANRATSVIDNQIVPDLSLSPTSDTHCEVPNGSITATITNQIGPVSDYTFEWYDGPSMASPLIGSNAQTVTSLDAGTYTVAVLHVPSQCQGVASTALTNLYTYPSINNASGLVCETTAGSGTASVNLTTYNSTITGGNADLVVTWRDGSLNPITSAVVSTGTTISHDVKSNTSGCVVANSLTFTVDAQPSVANAGIDIASCTPSVTLAGSTPAVGAGNWTIISGAGGSLGTPASPTSSFTGVAGTTYTLQWTVTNGTTCTPSTDAVNVTFNVPPTAAAAGTDISVCGTSTALAANTPTVGTGSWSIISGAGGSITTASSPTSNFTGIAGSTYTLRWTVSNSPCAASTDDVVVTFTPVPLLADAGPDMSFCGTSVTLAGNDPSPSTGAWSIVSGAGGSFGSSTSSTSSFTGTAGQVYVLRWTIVDGCASNFDDVTITLDDIPTSAYAGEDTNVCGTTTTLTANTPTVGSGAWTVVSGVGGSFGNSSSPASTFSGTVGTTYILRWTISNGACAPSADNVSITFNPPPTVANAGTDRTVCGFDLTLAGNMPTFGVGTWTTVSGTGDIFGNVNNPASSFTGTPGQTYVLRWTISDGCSSTFDDVTVVLESEPTSANAGADQDVCGVSTTLAANTPTVGSGAWTIVSGAGGSFGNAASANSTFSGVSGTVYTLQWTISNGTCTPSSDQVVITLPASATTATAGADQSICGLSTTLAGNTPVVGSGAWTVVSGAGGVFSNSASPATTFSGTGGQTYVLRWTISDACSSTFDEVSIALTNPPSTASAGTDIAVCGTSTTLAGNTPSSGTGSWSVVSGAGATIGNTSLATSSFTGVAGTSYVLRWTISSGSCAVSSDDVAVTLTPLPTVATAGADQTVCGTSVNLGGNTPAVGNGTWSVVSGAGGTLTNSSSPTSNFTGVAGQAYVLRWTITNASCTPSSDDVSISFTAPPSTANAGADIFNCDTFATLSATAPSSGTGSWSVISGIGGSFSSTAIANAGFSGAAGTTYTLRWTVAKPGCPSNTDDVTVEFRSFPQGIGSIAPLTAICTGGSTTLTVSGITNVTEYLWSGPAGIDINSGNTSSADVVASSGSGGTITVIPVNVCGQGTPVTGQLSILPLPTVQVVLPESPLPAIPVTFSVNSDAALQTINWTFGDGGSSSDPAPQHSFGAPGEYEITATVVSASGCENSDTQVFSVLEEPQLNDRAIKNVITANGDDQNGLLYIENLERYPENEVRFLDRWGVELYNAKNYQNDWDARGKDGNFLPAGQYVCIVKLTESGKVISRTVSIIRGR